MNIIAIWQATQTRRWHRHPHLSATVDPVSAHQGRVALLALCLFPTWHGLHRVAIMHDMGEAVTGDVPKPVKDANPDMKAALDRIETEEMARLGLPSVDLSDIEDKALRLCDKLDAILWAKHHYPDLLMQDCWKADMAEVMRLCWAVNHGHYWPMIERAINA